MAELGIGMLALVVGVVALGLAIRMLVRAKLADE